jgi:cell division protein FtsB
VDVPDRFSTATRLKALGVQAQARVYRAAGRRPAVRRPRNKLTGRAAVLALVVCALVVALAYPMRQYIAQRSQIADQRRKAQQVRERVDQLREEKARWQDPAYVRTQARIHLHYLMPGQTGYVFADPTGATGASLTTDGLAYRAAYDTAVHRPWYRNLWDGVDHADAASR